MRAAFCGFPFHFEARGRLWMAARRRAISNKAQGLAARSVGRRQSDFPTFTADYLITNASQKVRKITLDNPKFQHRCPFRQLFALVILLGFFFFFCASKSHTDSSVEHPPVCTTFFSHDALPSLGFN